MARLLLTAAAAIILVAGCNKLQLIENSEHKSATLYASIPDDPATKATIAYGSNHSVNGAAVSWEDGDMIKVEDADESRVYTLSSGAGTKRAEFTGAALTFSAGAAINAYYPSSVSVVNGHLKLSGYDVFRQLGGSTDVVSSKMVMTATATASAANTIPAMSFTHKTGLLQFRIGKAFIDLEDSSNPLYIMLRCIDADTSAAKVFAVEFDDSKPAESKYTYSNNIVLQTSDLYISEDIYHAYIPVLPSKDLTGKTIEITIWNHMWYSRVVTISAGQLLNFGNRFEAGKLYYFNMSSSGTGSMVYSPTRAINGVKWATGHLVADGANGCRVGGVLDGGLYFRWGGLIGWEGSTLTAVVKPSAFTQTPVWNIVNPYDATDYASSILENPSSKPITDSPANGIGDPCRVYLGAGWRMPTSRELRDLFGKPFWDYSSIPIPYVRYNDNFRGLFFPISSYITQDGYFASPSIWGYVWSATPSRNATESNPSYAFTSSFRSTEINPVSDGLREWALPVRCVQE